MAAIYTAKKYLRCYNNSDTSESTFSLDDFDIKSQFSMEDVRNCARCFHQLANLIQQSKLQMITQKFKGPKSDKQPLTSDSEDEQVPNGKLAPIAAKIFMKIMYCARMGRIDLLRAIGR